MARLPAMRRLCIAAVSVAASACAGPPTPAASPSDAVEVDATSGEPDPGSLKDMGSVAADTGAEKSCPWPELCAFDGRCARVDLACVATSDATCAASYNCHWYGACHRLGDGCAPTTDSDCENNSPCAGGSCAVVTMPYGPECSPTKPEHCKNSQNCKDEGLCHLAQVGLSARCVRSASDPSDCAKYCQQTTGHGSGECSLVDGLCVPKGPADCLSGPCQVYGNCLWNGKFCEALGDTECQASYMCTQAGWCTKKTYATASFCGVASASDCAKTSSCALSGKGCVFVPPEYCVGP